MLAANAQAVQHCSRELLSLRLALDEQAVQDCGYPTFSTELYLPALEFSWRHVKDRLPVWQESQSQHAMLSTAFGS